MRLSPEEIQNRYREAKQKLLGIAKAPAIPIMEMVYQRARVKEIKRTIVEGAARHK